METVRLLVLSDDSNRRRRQRTSAPFGCVGAFAAVCTRPSRFTARFALVCFYPKLFHFAGTTSPVVCVCLSLYLTFANAKFPTWYSSGSALPTRSHCSRDRNGTADSEDEMGTAERHKFFFEKPQNSFPIAGGATANCDPFGTKVG